MSQEKCPLCQNKLNSGFCRSCFYTVPKQNQSFAASKSVSQLVKDQKTSLMDFYELCRMEPLLDPKTRSMIAPIFSDQNRKLETVLKTFESMKDTAAKPNDKPKILPKTEKSETKLPSFLNHGAFEQSEPISHEKEAAAPEDEQILDELMRFMMEDEISEAELESLKETKPNDCSAFVPSESRSDQTFEFSFEETGDLFDTLPVETGEVQKVSEPAASFQYFYDDLTEVLDDDDETPVSPVLEREVMSQSSQDTSHVYQFDPLDEDEELPESSSVSDLFSEEESFPVKKKRRSTFLTRGKTIRVNDQALTEEPSDSFFEEEYPDDYTEKSRLSSPSKNQIIQTALYGGVTLIGLGLMILPFM